MTTTVMVDGYYKSLTPRATDGFCQYIYTSFYTYGIPSIVIIPNQWDVHYYNCQHTRLCTEMHTHVRVLYTPRARTRAFEFIRETRTKYYSSSHACPREHELYYYCRYYYCCMYNRQRRRLVFLYNFGFSECKTFPIVPQT